MLRKRLLILGGQQKLCDIVIRAKQMGVYTVVTDWYEDSPAKKLADKACMVSTSDVEGILQLICEEYIDGVHQLAEHSKQIQVNLQIYSVDNSQMIVTEFHTDAFFLE